jgi:threonine dehydratase
MNTDTKQRPNAVRPSVPASAGVPPTLDDIRAAHARLHGVVRETPCVHSRALSDEAGVHLWLKRDDQQTTGSFKERGAANALATLPAAQRRRGVVAASAGNHALGLAQHGPRCGVRVTLVMPRNAARVKVARCRALGAHVVLEGDGFAEADGFARTLAVHEGAHYVHPFDDPAVIAGQGTLGLEIVAQVSDVSVIVLPVGGGGLLAGVATAVKGLRPGVQVIPAEPASAPSFAGARAHGRPIDVAVQETLADGLAVARVGERTFAASRDCVDAVVTVTENEIAYAMLRLYETEGTKVEGAAAVALAAILSGRISGLAGRKVVVPVCGANVDESTFARALRMAAEYRHGDVSGRVIAATPG